jgi:hypothetical protein
MVPKYSIIIYHAVDGSGWVNHSLPIFPLHYIKLDQEEVRDYVKVVILVSGLAEPLVVFGSLPPFPRPLRILLHNYWLAGGGGGAL